MAAKTLDEKRHHKRVHISRLAMISAPGGDYPAYVEDISAGGVQLRNACADEAFGDHLAVGEPVAIDIEDISPLHGSVVRITDPMLAVTFGERPAGATELLMAELMQRQGLFGIADPEAPRRR